MRQVCTLLGLISASAIVLYLMASVIKGQYHGEPVFFGSATEWWSDDLLVHSDLGVSPQVESVIKDYCLERNMTDAGQKVRMKKVNVQKTNKRTRKVSEFIVHEGDLVFSSKCTIEYSDVGNANKILKSLRIRKE